ncbi:MAG: D-alanine--D-alanine ligase [Desulfobulbaceae bacterium]|uniref:D-alanine--D-alanine ligase n=1 Tax=Candidatus Desulfatifera sulfidica TaxID=2841691 RepID=A0A8J6N817_9BACT|nr:D-alanine--D-alanine ligase [Candidatus Desulfatifera sulfidica]
MAADRNSKTVVALLAGGRSGEREVSLKGAAGVEQALDPDRFEIRRYDPATDLARLAADAQGIDVAFILLHGRFGEDGTVQGFLDLLGIPYQGAGVLGSAMAMDKHVAKSLYRLHGLPVADWDLVQPGDDLGYEEMAGRLGLPLVVKPVREGSSLGMSIAHTVQELEAGVDLAFGHDSRVMVEAFIRGREITSGVIGNEELSALPLVEIIPGKEFAFFDYTAKYQPGASTEICPAPVSDDVTRQIQEYGLAAHRALELRGYSRTDMIMAEDGAIYLLETNTIPGMTPTSLLPQAAAAYGLDFSALLERLLELAQE